MDISKETLQTIVESLKRGETIIDISNRINESIKTTSKILSFCAENNDKFDALIPKNWPLNVNYGHIYLGFTPKSEDGSIVEGERHGELKRGDYVLTGDHIQSGRHSYAFIYEPELIEEIQYSFYKVLINDIVKRAEFERIQEKIDILKKRDNQGNIKELRAQAKELAKDHLRFYDSEWFSYNDINNGKVQDYCKEHYCLYYTKTNNTRLLYKKGRPLGQVSLRYLAPI